MHRLILALADHRGDAIEDANRVVEKSWPIEIVADRAVLRTISVMYLTVLSSAPPTTARVMGSRSRSSCGSTSAVGVEIRHQVRGVRGDLEAPARKDHDRGIRLLDDGGSRERMARTKRGGCIDRDLDRLARIRQADPP